MDARSEAPYLIQPNRITILLEPTKNAPLAIMVLALLMVAYDASMFLAFGVAPAPAVTGSLVLVDAVCVAGCLRLGKAVASSTLVFDAVRRELHRVTEAGKSKIADFDAIRKIEPWPSGGSEKTAPHGYALRVGLWYWPWGIRIPLTRTFSADKPEPAWLRETFLPALRRMLFDKKTVRAGTKSRIRPEPVRATRFADHP